MVARKCAKAANAVDGRGGPRLNCVIVLRAPSAGHVRLCVSGCAGHARRLWVGNRAVGVRGPSRQADSRCASTRSRWTWLPRRCQLSLGVNALVWHCWRRDGGSSTALLLDWKLICLEVSYEAVASKSAEHTSAVASAFWRVGQRGGLGRGCTACCGFEALALPRFRQVARVLVTCSLYFGWLQELDRGRRFSFWGSWYLQVAQACI